MNVHETNEIRELTTVELDEVTGGLLAQAVNGLVDAIASVVNDAAAATETAKRLGHYIGCKL